LDKFDLPYPEAIFELGYFRERPEACLYSPIYPHPWHSHKSPSPTVYAFARDFDPSVFRPTLSHSFLHLLHTKGALHTCFTQNIDGLERRAYVPQNKLVEAHGTIATARCVNCKSAYDTDKLWDAIRAGVLARCAQCEAVVKPDIVFFGESVCHGSDASISYLIRFFKN
jgi:NAD+-dependent protein deacetylase SIR2